MLNGHNLLSITYFLISCQIVKKMYNHVKVYTTTQGVVVFATFFNPALKKPTTKLVGRKHEKIVVGNYIFFPVRFINRA